MAMTELIKEMETAALAELNRANANFPLFNSKHEGWAVIKEELEETREALDDLESSVNVLWDDVRGKDIPGFIADFCTTDDIYRQAVAVAAEATQTAAMILKYSMSLLEKAESGVENGSICD